MPPPPTHAYALLLLLLVPLENYSEWSAAATHHDWGAPHPEWTYNDIYDQQQEKEQQGSNHRDNRKISLDRVDDDDEYEKRVRRWLVEFNEGYRRVRHEAALISWNYNTNITAANAQVVAEKGVERTGWIRPWREEAKLINMDRLVDPLVRRQVLFVRKGTVRENPERTREIINTHSKMQQIYNTGKVCVANGTCFSGEPELATFVQNTRDYDQLVWAWKAWRDAVGPPLRPLYEHFVQLTKMDAQEGGYPDIGAMWRQELESSDLEREVEDLFDQVRPLYLQLHAFVRYHLVRMYGTDRVDPTGPIPAHLLGNMWAQQWDSLYPYLVPYPEYATNDVTTAMIQQGYTSKKMFRLAEKFYTSIGLDRMTREFWERSLIEKPKDGREVACHGSATNFFDGKDYRIRMCTEVSERDLHTVHHEMGHVEYFMAYRKQPVVFQDGANSAFHEAIGETVQYSVLTPEHLHRVKLLDNIPSNYESDINFLLKQALLKLPLLPFSLLLDRWRWDVFSGRIKPSKYNAAWWTLRVNYQGVQSPIPRSERDFDPGAKYHIPDNTPYIRYYMSSFMQLMFHEALCTEKYGGELTVPIHRCDIYGSKRAGKKFRAMLSLGTSKPWEEALFILTGERVVSAKPLLRYFSPLYEWLLQENQKLGAHVGWEMTSKRSTPYEQTFRHGH